MGIYFSLNYNGPLHALISMMRYFTNTQIFSQINVKSRQMGQNKKAKYLLECPINCLGKFLCLSAVYHESCS